MRASIALSSVAVLLIACGTQQERAAYKENPVAAMAPQYGPGCAKHGYAEGSDQWRKCIVRSSTRDQLEQHALYHDRYMQWYWLR